MGFEADGETLVGGERFIRYRRYNPRRTAHASRDTAHSPRLHERPAVL
jgi:hypothetical protein